MSWKIIISTDRRPWKDVSSFLLSRDFVAITVQENDNAMQIIIFSSSEILIPDKRKIEAKELIKRVAVADGALED